MLNVIADFYSPTTFDQAKKILTYALDQALGDIASVVEQGDRIEIEWDDCDAMDMVLMTTVEYLAFCELKDSGAFKAAKDALLAKHRAAAQGPPAEQPDDDDDEDDDDDDFTDPEPELDPAPSDPSLVSVG